MLAIPYRLVQTTESSHASRPHNPLLFHFLLPHVSQQATVMFLTPEINLKMSLFTHQALCLSVFTSCLTW